MITYNATEEEARAFQEGKKTALLLPVEPQPKANETISNDGEENFMLCRPKRVMPIDSPFETGQRVVIKGTSDDIMMYFVVERVQAKRIDDVTEEEALALGYQSPEPGSHYHIGESLRPIFCAFDEMVFYWDEKHPELESNGNPWVWYISGKVEN